MDSNKNDQKIKYFLDVRRDLADQYNSIVGGFKKSHFILNAGAMSALSVYISTKDSINSYMQYASIIFLIGTVLSIFAIILDYYWAYLRLYFFDKHFLKKLQDKKNDNEHMLRIHSKIEHDDIEVCVKSPAPFPQLNLSANF